MVYTLNQLPPDLQVRNWVEGAQGQRVGADGVGRADLIAQGMLDAIDLWGYITPGVEVCFAQYGRIVFLDAAYAPRQLLDLRAYQRDGKTCATVNRAGTLVLLRSQGGAPPAAVIGGQSPALSDCMVQPTANLNLRQSPPDGLIIGGIWASESGWLRASEKSLGYFKVLYDGAEGWISGEYVLTRGDCGA